MLHDGCMLLDQGLWFLLAELNGPKYTCETRSATDQNFWGKLKSIYKSVSEREGSCCKSNPFGNAAIFGMPNHLKFESQIINSNPRLVWTL